MMSNCETEIPDFPIVLVFENVGRLKISMDDLASNQVFVSLNDIINDA